MSESAGGRPAALADAVSAGLAGTGVPALSAGVQRLMAAYRSGEVPSAPVMATRADAASYAAYRMPATAAAVAAAVRQLRLALPGWQPASLVDFGAGTGSAAWAACAELPELGSVTLLEQSAEAVKLGRAILGRADSPALRSANWQSWRLGTAGSTAGVPVASVPAADLATVSYVLGELPPLLQADLVRLALQAAAVVLLIEPGTPAGHARILAAREQLLASGYQLAAPCPHQLDCPLAVAGDWCHFGVRLPRSAVHRQAKGAELGYEDEKFSYVAAVRPPPAPERPAARVVRRPQQRKGLVMLDVCAADGASRRELIGKSKGEVYRRARKTAWGDRFE